LTAGFYISDKLPIQKVVYFQDNVQDGFGWAYPSWLSAVRRHIVVTSKPAVDTYVLARRDALSISVFLVKEGSVERLYSTS